MPTKISVVQYIAITILFALPLKAWASANEKKMGPNSDFRNHPANQYVKTLKCRDGTSPKITQAKTLSANGRTGEELTIKCKSGQTAVFLWNGIDLPATPTGFSGSNEPGTSSTGGRQK